MGAVDPPGQEGAAEEFRAVFEGSSPSFAVRAPGRVNLLGEHTDYNGLPVLPMALQRGVYLLGVPRQDGLVELRHRDPRYGPRSFGTSVPIPPFPTGDWGNYAKAAVQGVLEAGWVRGEPRGMDLLVWGDLPPAAGLSSSSALVVACALAFLRANEAHADPLALAELLAGAERYVGTQGGGMDQAICLLGQAGHALRIDFFPLRSQPVPLPGDTRVIVSHSLVTAPKTEGALLLYNRRPAECRLATALLNRALRQQGCIPEDQPRLGDLAAAAPDLLPLAESVLGERNWRLEDVASALGCSPAEVQEAYLRTRDGRFLPEPEDGFQLLPRVRHVLTEAGRVEIACESMRRGDAAAFGRAMDASHESCARDYGISTPELDALVAIAREAGALGSRLTGAGFGGCAVSLVPEGKASTVLEALRERYYGGYLRDHRPELLSGEPDWDDILFVGEPSAGASVAEMPGSGQ